VQLSSVGGLHDSDPATSGALNAAPGGIATCAAAERLLSREAHRGHRLSALSAPYQHAGSDPLVTSMKQTRSSTHVARDPSPIDRGAADAGTTSDATMLSEATPVVMEPPPQHSTEPAAVAAQHVVEMLRSVPLLLDNLRTPIRIGIWDQPLPVGHGGLTWRSSVTCSWWRCGRAERAPTLTWSRARAA
jgi:hypothetical protein